MGPTCKGICSIAIVVLGGSPAMGAITCPPMPAAVTTISKDVKSDIGLTVGGLGKLKAGDLGVKTEVASKNLFDKYPDVDRLLALQTMSATYCQMLNSSSIPDADRLNRWERFQDKVLELQTRSRTEPAKTKPQSAVSSRPSEASVPGTVKTSGNNSPVIIGTGGNVTINSPSQESKK